MKTNFLNDTQHDLNFDWFFHVFQYDFTAFYGVKILVRLQYIETRPRRVDTSNDISLNLEGSDGCFIMLFTFILCIVKYKFPILFQELVYCIYYNVEKRMRAMFWNICMVAFCDTKPYFTDMKTSRKLLQLH